MKTQQRMYNVKDVEMVFASKIITTSLNNHLSELVLARSTWTQEYVTDLNNRIDLLTESYLGLDKAEALRKATRVLSNIQTPAMKSVSFLKTQIGVDFGKKAKDIFADLGFTKYLKKARDGDQEAQIQLLYAIKKGMTDKLKAEIVANGTNPELIENILAYATQLSNANLTQETLKSNRKTISAEALSAFNKLYSEIIGICKIASAYFIDQPLIKEKFTFSKVVAKMNASRKMDDKTTEAAE